jgi:hypothetical protein
MCGKLFTMKRKNYTLMGMPIEILNEKYQRHAIEFNFGFFLNKRKYSNQDNKQKDMEIYGKILKKIGEKLTELELESEFIWNEDKKTQLRTIVYQLYEQLEDNFNCFIKIDEYNCLNYRFNDDEAKNPQSNPASV